MGAWEIFGCLLAAFMFLCAVPIACFALGLHLGIKTGSLGVNGLIRPKGDVFQAEDKENGPQQAPDNPFGVVDSQVNRFLNDFLGRQEVKKTTKTAPIGVNYIDPELAGQRPDRAKAPGVDDE